MFIVAGPCPGLMSFESQRKKKDVDARDKPGYDELRRIVLCQYRRGPVGSNRGDTMNSMVRSEDFQAAVLRNPAHDPLLDDLVKLGLPDAWIVSGCLVQTVWNLVTGRPVGYGINDYDVFYFDPDLSWDAEDRVIRALRRSSDRLGVRVEARNQARVHLWYPQKHGTPYPALQCSTDGIDRFLTRNTQVGIQRGRDGDRLYAPAGLDDVRNMIVRPNLTPNFSASAYRIKTARWMALWPELTVFPPDAAVIGAGERVSP
jgi:hypothetical protein